MEAFLMGHGEPPFCPENALLRVDAPAGATVTAISGGSDPLRLRHPRRAYAGARAVYLFDIPAAHRGENWTVTAVVGENTYTAIVAVGLAEDGPCQAAVSL